MSNCPHCERYCELLLNVHEKAANHPMVIMPDSIIGARYEAEVRKNSRFKKLWFGLYWRSREEE